MKKLIVVVLFSLAFISCNNDRIEVSNPKKETTLELQQLAAIDTNTYKIVYHDETLYCINPKTNTVEKKISNDSGGLATVGLILFILIIIFFVVLGLATAD